MYSRNFCIPTSCLCAFSSPGEGVDPDGDDEAADHGADEVDGGQDEEARLVRLEVLLHRLVLLPVVDGGAVVDAALAQGLLGDLHRAVAVVARRQDCGGARE